MNALKPPPPTLLPVILDPFQAHAVLEVRAVMENHDWSSFAPRVVDTIEACMVAAYLRGQMHGMNTAAIERLKKARHG